MLYRSAQEWHEAREKRLLFFGMSGLGKTHLSSLLRDAGSWFHYSIDYRIGTRYMGEHIADNFKVEAMKNPFLAELLRTDSIYVASNITFSNLAPLSAYLGKPGDPSKGGLPFEEYMRRQEQHRMGEIAALLDTAHFTERARTLYGYLNFVCDTGGSICEVVDPDDPADPVLTALSRSTLMVWIKGSMAHTDELCHRFAKAPKPMYYSPDFLRKAWAEYLVEKNVDEDRVDPDDFIRRIYRLAMEHRQPIYAAMASKWGVTVSADRVAAVKTPDDVSAMIAGALDGGVRHSASAL
ncbi:MAG: ATPase [Pseudomonadota bacterium]